MQGKPNEGFMCLAYWYCDMTPGAESIELCDISEEAGVLDYVLTANRLAMAAASCFLMDILSSQTNYGTHFWYWKKKERMNHTFLSASAAEEILHCLSWWYTALLIHNFLFFFQINAEKVTWQPELETDFRLSICLESAQQLTRSLN